MTDRPLTLGIPLCSIGRWFAWSTVCLTLAGLVVVAFRFGYRYDRVYDLYALFDLDGDSSVPTWYASFTLLVCSVLLWMHGRITQASGRARMVGWYGLALIFLLMSIDETARVHEVLGTFIGNQVAPDAGQASGLISYHWILVGAAFAAAVAIIYVPFLYRLPRRISCLMIVSGAIYVAGALLVEDVNGALAQQFGYRSLSYQLGTVLEECLEMSGIALFAHTIAGYLVERVRGIDLVCEREAMSCREETDA